jgi:hypothetical protein
MNDDELKAAVSRYMKSWDAFMNRDMTASELMQHHIDERAIAKAYLARVDADEAERAEREKPIDEDWLLSIGFELSREGLPFHLEIEGFFKRSPANLVPPGKTYWDWKLEPPASNLLGVFDGRGQLLDLLRALGVEANP